MASSTIQNDLDRLLSGRSVRELLDVSERTLRRWIVRGIFPGPDKQVGSRRFWRASTVRAIVAGNALSVFITKSTTPSTLGQPAMDAQVCSSRE